MPVETIYQAILQQAWRPEAARFSAGEVGFTELAEQMADDIYRLCVEFGVEFNVFKTRVLDEVLNRSRLRLSDQSAETEENESSTLLEPVVGNLPILVFALELMPEDGSELPE